MSADNSLHLSWYGNLSPEEKGGAFDAFTQKRLKLLGNRFTSYWHDPKKYLTVEKNPLTVDENGTIRRSYWQPGLKEGEFDGAGSITFSIGDITHAIGDEEWAGLYIYKPGEHGRDLQSHQYVSLSLSFSHTVSREFGGFQFDADVEAYLNGLIFNVYYLRNRIVNFSVIREECSWENSSYFLDSGPYSSDIYYVLRDGEIPIGTHKRLYEAVVNQEAGSVSIQKRGTNQPECLLEFPLRIDNKRKIAESLAPSERFADPFETPPIEDISWMGADLLAKLGVKIHGLNNYKKIENL